MKWRSSTMDNDMYNQSVNHGSSNARELSGGEKFGWTILGILIPLVGLILWLVWKEEKPAESKCLKTGFFIGLGINIVMCLLVSVLGVITAAIVGTVGM